MSSENEKNEITQEATAEAENNNSSMNESEVSSLDALVEASLSPSQKKDGEEDSNYSNLNLLSNLKLTALTDPSGGEDNKKDIVASLTDTIRANNADIKNAEKMFQQNFVPAPVVSSGGNGKGLCKRLWSNEEDQLLTILVEKYGPKRWSLIANQLPDRIGKQCRERWHNHLSPDVRKASWSVHEDTIIFEYHKKLGNQWYAKHNNLLVVIFII